VLSPDRHNGAMTVHLVKMAVGIESLDHLMRIQKERRAGNNGILRHLTRNAPRRSVEVLDGGSIFWIIKGYIRARQRITGFADAVGRNGKPRCAILLDPGLKRVELTPHKPIQGWRYMEDAAAPGDIGNAEGKAIDGLPEEMAAELKSLGLI